MVISNRYINSITTPGDDGIGLYHEEYCHVHDCIIDLSACALDTLDEALGITYGAHGLVENCVIRGAGKLVLCGCGDDEKVPVETGKGVTFKHCLFENFSRRGPEVQNGMVAVLSHCVVRNWGEPERFTQRAFGAWAHKGGRIIAQHSVFINDVRPGFRYWFADHIGHLGQAINERGWKGLFTRDAWLSGYKRALTAGPDGYVEARQCFADEGLVMDNAIGTMSDEHAMHLLFEIETMANELERKLRP